MKTLKIVLPALFALVLPSITLAQSGAYPSKPIRLLIPFASGGGADIVCRPFVQKLSERLGQSIVYENRGGAGGVLAGETVARAASDGYTLLVGAMGVMTVTGNLMKMSFDPVKDFAPVTKIADVASLLATRPSLAPRTMKEIVAYARANPGKIAVGILGYRLTRTPVAGVLQAGAGL